MPSGQTLLAKARAARDEADADRLAREAVCADPGLGPAYALRARLAARRGDAVVATLQFRAAYDRGDESTETRAALALCFEIAGEPDQARAIRGGATLPAELEIFEETARAMAPLIAQMLRVPLPPPSQPALLPGESWNEAPIAGGVGGGGEIACMPTDELAIDLADLAAPPEEPTRPADDLLDARSAFGDDPTTESALRMAIELPGPVVTMPGAEPRRLSTRVALGATANEVLLRHLDKPGANPLRLDARTLLSVEVVNDGDQLTLILPGERRIHLDLRELRREKPRVARAVTVTLQRIAAAGAA